MSRLILLVTLVAASGPFVAMRAQDETKPVVVVIDPGHGGSPSGPKKWDRGQDGEQSDGGAANHAKSPDRTILEKDLTLRYSEEMRDALERHNFGVPLKVVLTREKDVQMGAMERAAIAVKNDADIFLSVHFNASEGHNARGTRMFYVPKTHPRWEYFNFTNPYEDRDVFFSNCIGKEVDKVFTKGGLSRLKVRPDSDNLKDGYRFLGYARQETHLWNCAVALLEVEFLDNAEAWEDLRPGRTGDRTRKEVAAGVVVGVSNYLAVRERYRKPAPVKSRIAPTQPQ